MICLDQKSYIQKIIKKYGMEDCKPTSTPYDPSNKLSRDMMPKNEEEEKEMKNVPYREAVGGLLYISQGTRPDVAYAVSTVSRYMQNLGRNHWTAVKRILRYLRGTLDYRLQFGKDQAKGHENITGYCDADWANESDTRRSVTGNIFLFQGGPITWQSKLQSTVALSTTEAEYMALSAGCQEAMWLRALVRDLQPLLVSSPTELYNDNKGAIDLVKNGGYRSRTKHIDIRHHFIREMNENSEIVVNYLPTTEMIADALTKGLYASKFKDCITRMGLIDC
ncbi:gag-pol polyprotein [Lasius niger]|uniref:Gag-pol polyprotein n=1 Tax=Lasius niger TaxID=67767 RepID=A0A0J7N0A8_LASNI|nr:gag-pol polyprotein [Lasius niger]